MANNLSAVVAYLRTMPTKVAARFGKIEKCRSHHGANRVATDVLSPRIAAAVPVKSGQRLN
jgi:hypothetical protein